MPFTNFGTIGGPSGATTPGHMVPPYYANFLRENLYGNLYWRQMGTLITIPAGHGTTARISRWQTPLKITDGQMDLSASITAVSQFAEETAITVQRLCANSITGEVTGWAGGRGYTDKTVIVSMANFLEGALESLSRELGFRIDRFDRQKVSSFAFTIVAANKNTGTPAALGSVASNATLVGKNCARIRPLMGANGVPRWDDGTYVGITHELAAHDMFTDVSSTGFVSVARYNDARQIYRGEVGEFYGVRWLLSNGSVTKVVGSATNSAQYGLSGAVTGTNAYILGPDAFYNLELETGGVEVIHQPLGSGGATGDPAAQLGSISVKVYYGVLPAPAGDRRIMRFVHALGLGF